MGMFLGTPQPIIMDGLRCFLDAGNPASAPGNNTWLDLSGNGFNGSVTGTPTLNTTDGGTFDCTNSSHTFDVHDASSVLLPSGQSFTINLWFKPSTSNNFVFEGGNSADYLSSVAIESNIFYIGASGRGTSTDLRGTTNQWNFISYVADQGSTAKAFKNGSAISMSSNSGTVNHDRDQNKLFMFKRLNGSSFGGGTLSMIQIYTNKAFTLAEHTQNYNAHKHRFGL